MLTFMETAAGPSRSNRWIGIGKGNTGAVKTSCSACCSAARCGTEVDASCRRLADERSKSRTNASRLASHARCVRTN